MTKNTNKTMKVIAKRIAVVAAAMAISAFSCAPVFAMFAGLDRNARLEDENGNLVTVDEYHFDMGYEYIDDIEGYGYWEDDEIYTCQCFLCEPDMGDDEYSEEYEGDEEYEDDEDYDEEYGDDEEYDEEYEDDEDYDEEYEDDEEYDEDEEGDEEEYDDETSGDEEFIDLDELTDDAEDTDDAENTDEELDDSSDYEESDEGYDTAQDTEEDTDTTPGNDDTETPSDEVVPEFPGANNFPINPDGDNTNTSAPNAAEANKTTDIALPKTEVEQIVYTGIRKMHPEVVRTSEYKPERYGRCADTAAEDEAVKTADASGTVTKSPETGDDIDFGVLMALIATVLLSGGTGGYFLIKRMRGF